MKVFVWLLQLLSAVLLAYLSAALVALCWAVVISPFSRWLMQDWFTWIPIATVTFTWTFVGMAVAPKHRIAELVVVMLGCLCALLLSGWSYLGTCDVFPLQGAGLYFAACGGGALAWAVRERHWRAALWAFPFFLVPLLFAYSFEVPPGKCMTAQLGDQTLHVSVVKGEFKPNYIDYAWIDQAYEIDDDIDALDLELPAYNNGPVRALRLYRLADSAAARKVCEKMSEYTRRRGADHTLFPQVPLIGELQQFRLRPCEKGSVWRSCKVGQCGRFE